MPTLEDYIYDMEHRVELGGVNGSPEDLWTQLQQKEADLVLAAELGKALLEKNEELKKQQDNIIEEYSRKLEVSDNFFQNNITDFLIIFVYVYGNLPVKKITGENAILTDFYSFKFISFFIVPILLF